MRPIDQQLVDERTTSLPGRGILCSRNDSATLIDNIILKCPAADRVEDDEALSRDLPRLTWRRCHHQAFHQRLCRFDF
jgi:hypothetical protein